MSVRPWAGTLVLAIGLGLAPHAVAAEPDAPDRLPNQQEVQAIKFRQALVAAIDHSAAEGATPEERAALSDYYADHADTPLWIAGQKITAAADAVVAVFAKAEDYALKASDYRVPPTDFGAGAAEATPEQLASAEVQFSLASLHYAHDAHVGRILPEQVSPLIDRESTPPNPKKVLEGLAKADDAGKALLAYQPQHPQFELLRKKYLELKSGASALRPVVVTETPSVPDATAATETVRIRIPRGPTLHPGDRHPQVAILRERLGAFLAPDASNEDQTSYDDVLAEAVRKFQAAHALPDDGVVDRDLRRVLNASAPKHTVVAKAVQAPPRAPDASAELDRVLVNLQRWRWMREDIGDFYVMNNVPEFLTRVVDHGKVIFTEKIVTGKPDTPTPTFSQDMQFVEFHPFWNVPNSIKEGEILPGLLKGSDIMDVQDLHAFYKGQPADVYNVDWSRTDIKTFDFQQPPGEHNVLGVVKFVFPNHFDVYMHDTPSKTLFNKSVRAYSHGCMRVHNPDQFAAVLLEHDQGWSRSDIERAITDGGNQQVRLQKKIPVHVTYFTSWVQDDGSLSTYADIYGHDHRLSLALNGKTEQLAQEVAALVKKPKAAPDPGLQDSGPNFLSQLFGGN